MAWIFFTLLQGALIWSGIRQEKQAGLWSWSKFAFALGFAGLECLILIAPLSLNSRPYFMPLWICCWVIAAANFVWFILVCRRWRLPDGRTSLEAERDFRSKK